jgi:hypothetical protein
MTSSDRFTCQHTVHSLSQCHNLTSMTFGDDSLETYPSR